jgi:hypothetical protein
MDFVPLTPFFYTLSLFLQMAKVEIGNFTQTVKLPLDPPTWGSTVTKA